MSPNPESTSDSSRSSPPDLPEDFAERLSDLSESELRAVISYAESLLPELPSVDDLLEEQPGEEILEIDQEDGYTKVVKTQPCMQGCAECPHGPYLYHITVEKNPKDGEEPSLHWEFIGPVQ